MDFGRGRALELGTDVLDPRSAPRMFRPTKISQGSGWRLSPTRESISKTRQP
jgi:hypothetical protein